jgi:competence protein ComEC
MLVVSFYSFAAAYCVMLIALTFSGILLEVLAGLAAIVGAAAWSARAQLMRCGAVAAAAGIGVALLRTAYLSDAAPEAFRDLFDQKGTLTGTVVALPDLRETSDRITVELRNGLTHTRILAAVPLYPPVHAGDLVEVTGTLRHPKAFETDGGRTFSYPEYLRKDGIYGTMQPAQVKVMGRSRSAWLRLLRLLESLKSALVSSLNLGLPDPENSLAVGILVGGKQGLGKELLDQFGKAGMLQIVVLSGYNVMIVANALMRVIGRFPALARFAVGSASIICFVLIAGAGSAALRAGLMALLAIAARTFDREYDVLLAVFGSVLVLSLYNPLLLVYDPGFQFSFVATLGLIIGVPVIAPRLAFLGSPLLIELLSTTLAAEITLLPLLLWQTGNLSLVSVAANVVAMPAVPLAMGASAAVMLVSFPLSLLHPVLPVIAGLPAYLPLAYVIKVATLFASLPFSTVIIPAFPFWVALACYAGLALLWLAIRPRPESGARPCPSSGSPGTPPRTSSSPQACSRP